MSQRHRSRRLALQGLCCLNAQSLRVMDLVNEFIDDSREQPRTISDAHKLLDETFANLEKYDSLLARHAKHWEMNRLAMVDRNILRLGVHEMCDSKTPLKVIITEAIKLAKEFSTSESPRFIHGVLDSVAKELKKT